MANVHPSLIIGSSTEVIAGEKLIITAGAIDAHVHYICPQQVEEALAAGTTTMIGGGTGPSAGTNATTCTSSPFYMRHMLAATDGLAMNFAFTGKGNDAGRKALEDIVKAGAAGLKLHEDWGSTPATIRNCLDVGDDYDVQVNFLASIVCHILRYSLNLLCRSISILIPLTKVVSLRVSHPLPTAPRLPIKTN